MDYYNIYFQFREKQRSALVQEFTFSYSVWFVDEEIVHDFGSEIDFTSEGEACTLGDAYAPDFKELCTAIQDQLH